MFEHRLKKRVDSMLDVHYKFCHDKKLKCCMFNYLYVILLHCGTWFLSGLVYSELFVVRFWERRTPQPWSTKPRFQQHG